MDGGVLPTSYDSTPAGWWDWQYTFKLIRQTWPGLLEVLYNK